MAGTQRKFDAKSDPLVTTTLEPAPQIEMSGEYDETTETWSHRKLQDLTPKKNNEEK